MSEPEIRFHWVALPGESLPHAPPLWHTLDADGVLLTYSKYYYYSPREGWELVTEGRESRVVDPNGRCG